MIDRDQEHLIEMRPFQFSLRRVLIVMFVVAGLFAAAAPWTRQFSSGAVAMLIVVWSVALAIFFGVLLLGTHYYRRTREKAGEVLCVVERSGHAWQLILFWVAGTLQFAAAVVFSFLALTTFEMTVGVSGSGILELRESNPYLLRIALLICLVAFSLSGSIIFMLRSRYGAICENGLIFIAICYPWSSVKRDEWRVRGDRLQLVFKSRRWRTWKFNVPRKEQAEVAAVLEQVSEKYGGA